MVEESGRVVVVAGFIVVVGLLMYAVANVQAYNDRCYAIPAPTDGCERALLHPNYKPR